MTRSMFHQNLQRNVTLLVIAVISRMNAEKNYGKVVKVSSFFLVSCSLFLRPIYLFLYHLFHVQNPKAAKSIHISYHSHFSLIPISLTFSLSLWCSMKTSKTVVLMQHPCTNETRHERARPLDRRRCAISYTKSLATRLVSSRLSYAIDAHLQYAAAMSCRRVTMHADVVVVGLPKQYPLRLPSGNRRSCSCILAEGSCSKSGGLMRRLYGTPFVLFSWVGTII